MDVLFLNHKEKRCGVYQYGIRVYAILNADKSIRCTYHEIDCFSEYNLLIAAPNENKWSAIIYNFHGATMSWLTKGNIKKFGRNIGITHESRPDLFNIICEIDPTAPETHNVVPIPRPLFENVDELLLNYKSENPEIEKFINFGISVNADKEIPVFGSFGFSSGYKNFAAIVKLVNDTYDRAIIKLVITVPKFGRDLTALNLQQCTEANYKPGVQLMITNEFFSTEDMLKFLKSNTMNIFFYGHVPVPFNCVSSSTDYAMSVGTPFAISESNMYKHIYSDEICVSKRTLPQIMKTSPKHIAPFLHSYSNDNLRAAFARIIARLAPL